MMSSKRVTIVLSEGERDKFVRWCFQAMKTTPSAILTRLTYQKIRDARVASWGRGCGSAPQVTKDEVSRGRRGK